MSRLGFYLWHWPMLVIPAEYLGHPLSVATNLVLLVGAFTLSVATYWLFENPLRYSDLLERSRSALALWPVTVGLVILVANLGIGLIEYRVAPSPIFLAAPKVATTGGNTAKSGDTTTVVNHDPYTEAVAASVAPARLRQSVPTNLNPSPLNLDGYTLGDCAAGPPPSRATSSQICRMGDTHAHRTMVLFGDSHAQMWMPALLPYATSHHWTLIPFVRVGCTTATFAPESAAYASCHALGEVGISPYPATRPALIIVSSAYSGEALNGDPNGIQVTGNGFWNELRAFKGSASLAVIQDIPYPLRSPIDCLLAHDATLGSCTFQLSDRFNETIDSDVALSAKLLGARFIPVVQWFCARSQCPMVIGNTIVYFDATHVSTAYAQQLARPLDAALKAATQA